MCGIYAVWDTKGTVDRDFLVRMIQTIRHRGPDDEGMYLNGGVGLAARRLSIIDLAGGHQPLSNEDGTIWVAQNGEIYNYQSLRRELEAAGHRFRTRSDTESIVHAYEEWGEDCASHLHGMFAFAVYDERRNRLLLSRDRLGKKPLYYYHADGRWIFASEIKAILADRSVPRRLNPRGLNSYLTIQYIPGPATILGDVWKLPPGHNLVLDESGARVTPYWELSLSPDGQDEPPEQVEANVRDLLVEAVRARLMSDVPLGAFLSGGVDSSLVVALMAQMMGERVKTFSVGFREAEFDEAGYARLVARHLDTDHHDLLLEDCSADLLRKVVWHLDEPLADAAAVPTYLLSELAARSVTVVLTGEGADELFAGYNYYWRDRWLGRLQRVPGLTQVGGYVLAGLNRPRAGRWAWQINQPPERRLAAWTTVFTPDEKAAVLAPAVRELVADHDPLAAMTAFYRAGRNMAPLQRSLYVDTKTWLPDDLLMKVDKMSMAASLEARAPYLDHRLVEYVSRLPTRYKLRGRADKWLLRKVASAWLPPEVTRREKHGFNVPLGHWLRGALRSLSDDLLDPDRIARQGWLDPQRVAFLRRQVNEGRLPSGFYARQVWTLLWLQTWADLYEIRDIGDVRD